MTDTPDIPPIMTIEEAAHVLRVHPRTVLRRIRDGTLKAGKFGGQWRILRENLIRALEEDTSKEEKGGQTTE